MNYNSTENLSVAKNRFRLWHIPFLLALIVGTFYICSDRNIDSLCSDNTAWSKSNVQQLQGKVFGTVYHITYDYSHDLQDSINSTLNEVDFTLSPFNEKSEITAVNNNKDIEVSPMFQYVFNLAKKVSDATDGAFDITVSPLVNLWGFGFKNSDNVTDSAVNSLLPFVGYRNVHLDGNRIIKQYEETMLDCSAIAKGFGVDAVGLMFERLGIRNYMVEIGGEVRVRGNNPSGKKWSIGVSKPKEDELQTGSEIEDVLVLTDMSMATSGNYRNYYEKDGKKFAHTIDPRTGYPVQTNILSATVIADDCALADAFATSFMVLGLDATKSILQNHNDIHAYIIYNNEDGCMKVWYSPSVATLIKK